MKIFTPNQPELIPDQTQFVEKGFSMFDIFGNWGAFLISNVLHPLTIVATPLFLFILIAFFVVQAFLTSKQAGIRSLSAALLPCIVITFVYVFGRDLLSSFGYINTLFGFIAALIWGIVVMVIIRVFSSIANATFPLSELVLSGSFNILVFSYVYVGKTQTNILSLYYGLISGFLIYIIFFGLPKIKKEVKKEDKK
jgi:hypothetical protein